MMPKITAEAVRNVLANVRENKAEPPRVPRLPERCPMCHTRAMMLWKYWGETYLKCERCGYELR
jgi:DNA-directed RNA polymerase subunit M/transcription elongation factor TFIIS